VSAQDARQALPDVSEAIDNRQDDPRAVCPACGLEFALKGRNRKRRIYCSRRCTNRAWVSVHRRPITKKAALAKPRRKHRRTRPLVLPPGPKAVRAMVWGLREGSRKAWNRA
jgi:hypothetical protein